MYRHISCGWRSVLVGSLSALLLGAAACGVAQSGPESHGDRLRAALSVNDGVQRPPEPSDASDPESLVRDFLKAPVGGGEAAVDQVLKFLTGNARSSWQEPETTDPTVIRIIGELAKGVDFDGRVPVDVGYQVVGVLTDRGRVDSLTASPQTGTMRFWVVSTQDGLRIDGIDGAPEQTLLLSDEALDQSIGGTYAIYRIQPVYFWDKGRSLLVPDLRYLPLTLNEEGRANRLVDWLLEGPSGWLTAGVQPLPSGAAKDGPVVLRDSTIVVSLNAEAAPSVDDAERLLTQLHYTLNHGTTNPVELRIGGQDRALPASRPESPPRSVRADTFIDIARRYDIVDGKVVIAGTLAVPPILDNEFNTGVVAAAISREGSVAALVRQSPSGLRDLQLLFPTGRMVEVSELPRCDDTARPSWVPGTNGADQLILAACGALYLVTPAGGEAHQLSTKIGYVTSATVSPDGRRIAIVADGEVYVAPLIAAAEGLTIGSSPRQLLAGSLSVAGAAWISDAWLYVGGTRSGNAAMWRVSADGVVANDETGSLKGQVVTDIVSWPGIGSRLDVIVYTPQAPYFLLTTGLSSTGYQAPFYGG